MPAKVTLLKETSSPHAGIETSPSAKVVIRVQSSGGRTRELPKNFVQIKFIQVNKVRDGWLRGDGFIENTSEFGSRDIRRFPRRRFPACFPSQQWAEAALPPSGHLTAYDGADGFSQKRYRTNCPTPGAHYEQQPIASLY